MEQYNKGHSCGGNCCEKQWDSNVVKFDLFLLVFNLRKENFFIDTFRACKNITIVNGAKILLTRPGAFWDFTFRFETSYKGTGSPSVFVW